MVHETPPIPFQHPELNKRFVLVTIVPTIQSMLFTRDIEQKLLALDTVTGANLKYFNLKIADALPNAWGGVAVYKLAIDPTGTRLVATGNFQTVAGQPRARLFVADISGGKAALHPWYYPGFAKPCSSTHPRRIAYLQGVDFAPDGSYFVVAATGQVPLYKK